MCATYTPDLTSPDMTGYTLDSTAEAWSQQVNFTHLFTWIFPSVSVVLSVIFIQLNEFEITKSKILQDCKFQMQDFVNFIFNRIRKLLCKYS